MMTTADAQTFRHALALFERRAFFECHEALEPLWLADRTDRKPFFQGLIQLAAAFVHWQRGHLSGILPLLEAAQDKLAAFPPDMDGLDLRALLVDLDDAMAYFRGPGATVAGFPADRLPRIRHLPVRSGMMP